MGSLILSNATLYGMTSSRVFKMNTNGGSCSNLHSFGGFLGNASGPHAALTLSGTNLYGMTVEGGAGVGVAFRVSTDGLGYTALHYFNGRETNGSRPYGSLTLANGALYGTTLIGGTNNLGTLFRMDTDGGHYTNLHAFAGGAADGADPGGDLTLSGTNFYGMTSQGGAAGLGVVFRVNTDGTGYTNLHSFAGYPSDGAGPPGSLTLDGSTLYGMTQEGGTNQSRLGMVFKMKTDGSGYVNLHSFAGGTGDGATPLGSLTLANGWLYGMTSVGGASNKGTVFRVSTDGRSYTNVHSFAGGVGDGATPYGSLMLIGFDTLRHDVLWRYEQCRCGVYPLESAIGSAAGTATGVDHYLCRQSGCRFVAAFGVGLDASDHRRSGFGHLEQLYRTDDQPHGNESTTDRKSVLSTLASLERLPTVARNG